MSAEPKVHGTAIKTYYKIFPDACVAEMEKGPHQLAKDGHRSPGIYVLI